MAHPDSMGYVIVGYTKCDDWWYDRLMAMGRWLEHRNPNGLRYARLSARGGKYHHIRMHQVVGGGQWVDHKDGDGLNNQESNLRSASRSDQNSNQRLRKDSASGEPGVYFHKGNGKWCVQVRKNKRIVFREYFSTREEAVAVARQKRKEIHGEFVRETPDAA
jgi:hypothetical protein